MKKFLPIILLLILISSFKASAQISQGGLPPSFKTTLSAADIDNIILPSPDMQAVAAQDEEYLKTARPYRIGINIPVNATMENSGTWTDLPNHSGKIWRLKLHSAGASGLNIRFEDFFMPTGSKFYIYNESHTHVLGAFTEVNNNDDGSFATEVLQGETAILEYFQPSDVQAKARMALSNVAYIYRGMESYLKAIAGSGSCEVNIACSEGTNWQDEKKGVLLIETVISGGTFLCSGSVMNNTKGDCTPYVLLADHCSYDAAYASAADMNTWVFYFHYEATTCTGTAPSGVKSMTGCTLKAHDTYGSNNSGSDFYLVQLKTAIPASNNAYFNGWSRSTSPSSSGVGIHHPAGDIKKISTYTSALTSISVGGTGSHWEVTWAATTNGHGVTEGGSSGSPLFNSAGLVIGTLTGGTSYCTTPNDPDYYGKFAQHWTSNGTTSAKQLKPWLDPLNTNPTTLNGTYSCTSSIDETKKSETGISVYPNPTRGAVTVDFGAPVKGTAIFTVNDILGQQVRTIESGSALSTTLTIDLSGLKGGIYFIGITVDNRTVTRKVILQD
ncbi:MAG: T9SS type A sorting domain-containing protein [Bacteroidota bacterium]